MKKWLIPAAVAALGVLLAYRYVERRRAESAAPAATSGVPAPQGVLVPQAGAPIPQADAPVAPSLPEPQLPIAPVAVQDRATPPLPQTPSPAPDPSLQPGPKVGKVVEDPGKVKGACEGGSYEDILNDQGRVWGSRIDRKKVRALPSEVSDGIRDRLADYTLCRALAAANPNTCFQLSLESPGGGEVSTPMTTQERCIGRYLLLSFAGGEGVREKALCEKFYTSSLTWMPLSPAEFCDPALKPTVLCDSIAERARSRGQSFNRKRCDDAIPLREASCGRDEDCVRHVRILRSFSDRSPTDLAPSEKALWDAFRTRSEANCAPVRAELEKFYCQAKETYGKKIGYLGMNDEEIKAAEARRLEEFRKLEEYHKQRRGTKPKHFE